MGPSPPPPGAAPEWSLAEDLAQSASRAARHAAATAEMESRALGRTVRRLFDEPVADSDAASRELALRRSGGRTNPVIVPSYSSISAGKPGEAKRRVGARRWDVYTPPGSALSPAPSSSRPSAPLPTRASPTGALGAAVGAAAGVAAGAAGRANPVTDPSRLRMRGVEASEDAEGRSLLRKARIMCAVADTVADEYDRQASEEQRRGLGSGAAVGGGAVGGSALGGSAVGQALARRDPLERRRKERRAGWAALTQPTAGSNPRRGDGRGGGWGDAPSRRSPGGSAGHGVRGGAGGGDFDDDPWSPVSVVEQLTNQARSAPASPAARSGSGSASSPASSDASGRLASASRETWLALASRAVQTSGHESGHALSHGTAAPYAWAALDRGRDLVDPLSSVILVSPLTNPSPTASPFALEGASEGTSEGASEGASESTSEGVYKEAQLVASLVRSGVPQERVRPSSASA